MRKTLLVLLTMFALAVPRPAHAWGFDAHKYILDRAIALLPAEIRPFFEKNRATIVEHAIDPDLWRTVGWEEESPRHYLDMDAYGPYPFKSLPHDFEAAVALKGRDFVMKNGLLPWRAQEIFTKLADAFTQKSGYSRENIKLFSSVLGHYLGDAQVPFHATQNHDGQLTVQWGIHSRFEAELFERYKDKLQVTPKPLIKVTSARDLVFDSLTTGFTSVKTILDTDKASIGTRDTYDDVYFDAMFKKLKPVLEDRVAASITAVASAITGAWEQAGKPLLTAAEPGRVPRKVRTQ